ncbi:substance-K receptor-like [Ischnura elegans]|uniref:substance-K receptor-like n=1 Tax=Ischnura elegans TaxID=197161 RepID=UPI001ED86E29|nr:substance-K receptor-like [Ischnura elegans]
MDLPKMTTVSPALTTEEGDLPFPYSCFAMNASDDHVSPPAGCDTIYSVPASVVVLLSLCYGFLSVSAVGGNALVIWAVFGSHRMRRSSTNFFIANLALADIIIGLFSIPFQFQAALLQRWDLPEFMCPFCPFVQVLSVNVSIFTLTAIAVDRHQAIVRPLSGARPSRLRARILIAAIWVVSAALALPMALALGVTHELAFLHPYPSFEWFGDEADGVTPSSLLEATEFPMEEVGGEWPEEWTKPFCSNVGISPWTMNAYRHALAALQYACPLAVISVAYAKVGMRLWGATTPGTAQRRRDANLLKNKKRVIKMLFIVVALFALCWLPLQTYNVMQAIFPHINQYKYINIIWFCCDWLAMSNSCCNPIIYGIYSDKFKTEFARRFRLSSTASSMSTRTQTSLRSVSSLRREDAWSYRRSRTSMGRASDPKAFLHPNGLEEEEEDDLREEIR